MPNEGTAGRDAADVSAEALPVSVLIPVFNRAHMLPRAIASVAAQSPVGPAEIVVVDDGSDDDSADVARKLGARVVVHPRNLGQAAARTTAVAAATQPWVAFLDSDDEWLPHHLATVWPLRGGRVLVGASALHCGPDPRQDRLMGPLSHGPRIVCDPAELIYPQNFLAMSTALVNRQAILRVGAFADHEGGGVEDLDMWLRLLENGTAVVSPVVSVVYHVHEAQLSERPGRTRSGHRAAIRAHSNRPWWREKHASRWEGVAAWGELRESLGMRKWSQAAGKGFRIARRPARIRGALDIIVLHLRARRATSRVTRRGTPSLAVAVLDADLRRKLSGEHEGARIVRLSPTYLIVDTFRLLRRPAGLSLIDSRGADMLMRALRIPSVDLRNQEREPEA